MSDTPAWVRVACNHWGTQKARIWSGGCWFINADGDIQHHADGFANSFLGKLLEEREGCGQGTAYQRWGEVLWGDALRVQQCLPGMPVHAFDALHLQYVFPREFQLNAAAKAALIGMALRAYWCALERAEFWLFAKLDGDPTPRLTSSVAPPHGASARPVTRNALLSEPKAGTNPGYPGNMPELRPPLALACVKPPPLK